MSNFGIEMMEAAHNHTCIFSNDPSTKVGAVITVGETPVSFGYNHVPQKFKPTEELMLNREWKYPRVIHAETDAIIKTRSSTYFLHNRDAVYHMYVTHHPCAECAKLIVAAGIKKVITNFVSKEMQDRWPGMVVAAELLREAGVSVEHLNFP